MDDLLNIILKDTYTLASFKHRLRILKSYLDKKFFGGQDAELLEGADNDWLKSLPDSFWEKFNKDNLISQISGLENKLNQLNSLIIYLAFEAGDDVSITIGKKVRELFQMNLLLDIRHNPALIAGCALVWQGIYKDYSLKSKIEARKSEILASLNKFLR